MTENDTHRMLLMAIECLLDQYNSLQTPCIALQISRHYRLLANLTLSPKKQRRYTRRAKSWLAYYIKNESHPQKIQNQLDDFVWLHEFFSLFGLQGKNCETASGSSRNTYDRDKN
ncbi:hypothetical protein CRENPOLYSF2_120006 [Crenothrix polyspora]|uniref:Uncharacterized protein n=1 Tax=Crenothrix polyspora TaxID=360316 RepID=A0A1R4H108_9GAMM|nr:hypothetical protein CRENPOLYSF2_120006 [Crenothrix polyspora]